MPDNRHPLVEKSLMDYQVVRAVTRARTGQRQPQCDLDGKPQGHSSLPRRADVNVFRPHQKPLTRCRLFLTARRPDSITRSDMKPKQRADDGAGPMGIPFVQHHCHSPELLQDKSTSSPTRRRSGDGTVDRPPPNLKLEAFGWGTACAAALYL